MSQDKDQPSKKQQGGLFGKSIFNQQQSLFQTGSQVSGLFNLNKGKDEGKQKKEGGLFSHLNPGSGIFGNTQIKPGGLFSQSLPKKDNTDKQSIFTFTKKQQIKEDPKKESQIKQAQKKGSIQQTKEDKSKDSEKNILDIQNRQNNKSKQDANKKQSSQTPFSQLFNQQIKNKQKGKLSQQKQTIKLVQQKSNMNKEQPKISGSSDSGHHQTQKPAKQGEKIPKEQPKQSVQKNQEKGKQILKQKQQTVKSSQTGQDANLTTTQQVAASQSILTPQFMPTSNQGLKQNEKASKITPIVLQVIQSAVEEQQANQMSINCRVKQVQKSQEVSRGHDKKRAQNKQKMILDNILDTSMMNQRLARSQMNRSNQSQRIIENSRMDIDRSKQRIELQQMNRRSKLYIQERVQKIQNMTYKQLIQYYERQYKDININIFMNKNKKQINKNIQNLINKQKYRKYQNIEIMQDNDSNKFINDFIQLICNLLFLNSSSLLIVNKLFWEFKNTYLFDHQFFIQNHINYNFIQSNFIYQKQLINGNVQYTLNMKSYPLYNLIIKFLKYYTSSTKCYINLIINNIQFLHPPQTLFYSLWKNTLYQQNTQFQQVQKIHQIIKSKLNQLLNQALIITPKYHLLNNQEIIHMIKLVDKTSSNNAIKISLKILLNLLHLENGQTNIPNNIISTIISTKSTYFLPFRLIFNQQEFYDKYPLHSDIYKYIQGSQWIEWLQLYLNPSKQLQQYQIPYIIHILSTMQPAVISNKLLKNSSIWKFFKALKQEGLIHAFYKAIYYSLYNQTSLSIVRDRFFKQKGQLTYEFKSIVQNIISFPNNSNPILQSEELQFMDVKLIYLLKCLQIAPQQQSNYLQRRFMTNLHNIHQIESHHKTCHFIIDVINYYSMTKRSQQVLCGAFKALLRFLKQHQISKKLIIAMNINRPSFSFINNDLQQELIQSINNVLHYILILHKPLQQNENMQICNIYPFRYKNEYQIYIKEYQKKYIIIPLYWQIKLLGIINKQKYHGQLLSIMIQKLIIYDNSIHQYKLAQYIIDIVNSLDLWTYIHQILKYKIISSNHSLKIYNDLLQSGQYYSIKWTLHLLKTIIILLKIKPYSVRLQRLQCLNSLEIQLHQLKTQLSSNKNIVMNCLGLLNNSPIIICQIQNPTLKYQIHWYTNNQIQQQFQYKQQCKYINYYLIFNQSLFPQNNYLQFNFSILSYSLDILIYIINDYHIDIQQQYNRILIQSHLNHLIIPLKQFIYHHLLKFINSIHFYKCWEFIRSLISHHNNYHIGQYIYLKYMAQNHHEHNIRILQSITQCHYHYSIKYPKSSNQNFLENILSNLLNLKITEPLNKILKYWNRTYGTSNWQQLFRIFDQREVMNSISFLKTLAIIGYLLLKQLYLHNSSVYCLLAQFNRYIIKNSLLFIYLTPQSYYDRLVNPININILLEYDYIPIRRKPLDPLEKMLSKEYKDKEIYNIEKDNQRIYVQNIIREYNKIIFYELAITLILNEFHNKNNHLSLNQYYSSLFCHLHLGTSIIEYRIRVMGQMLYGEQMNESINNIKYLQQQCLNKLQKYKQNPYIKNDILIIYTLSISWLRNKLTYDVLKDLLYHINQYINIILQCDIKIIIIFLHIILQIHSIQSYLNPPTIQAIKQLVSQSIKQKYNPNITHQSLTIYNILQPHNQTSLIELWNHQTNFMHFFNLSRIILNCIIKHSFASYFHESTVLSFEIQKLTQYSMVMVNQNSIIFNQYKYPQQQYIAQILGQLLRSYNKYIKQ